MFYEGKDLGSQAVFAADGGQFPRALVPWALASEWAAGVMVGPQAQTIGFRRLVLSF